ncbi:MAG: DUF1294 domain-containing protein [Lachnospiraceae bacterium]|nr:DUF1294 domain-containing protein [Lachnospiraceae bacterium]
MERMILCYVLLINILCFLLMGEDKRRARGGKYRIAEKHLFLAAALGGAFGGTLGMYVFRHKTGHWKFRLGFPLLALLWAAVLCALVLGRIPTFKTDW